MGGTCSTYGRGQKCTQGFDGETLNEWSRRVDSSWNVVAHGDAREGKWGGNWRMKWVASTLHTTSEHGVSSITTADAHTSAASSRLNWCPRRFKWILSFRRKTKSGFCACAITFQLNSTKTYVGGKGKVKFYFHCPYRPFSLQYVSPPHDSSANRSKQLV
jgi:hypothetical protein